MSWHRYNTSQNDSLFPLHWKWNDWTASVSVEGQDHFSTASNELGIPVNVVDELGTREPPKSRSLWLEAIEIASVPQTCSQTCSYPVQHHLTETSAFFFSEYYEPRG